MTDYIRAYIKTCEAFGFFRQASRRQDECLWITLLITGVQAACRVGSIDNQTCELCLMEVR